MNIKSKNNLNKIIAIVYSAVFLAFIISTSINYNNHVITAFTNIAFDLVSFGFGIYVLTTLAMRLDKVVKKESVGLISRKMIKEAKAIALVKVIWFANLTIQLIFIINFDKQSLEMLNDSYNTIFIIETMLLVFFGLTFIGSSITSILITKITKVSIESSIFKFIFKNIKNTFEEITFEQENNVEKLTNKTTSANTEEFSFVSKVNKLVIKSKLSSILSDDKKATTPPSSLI